MDRTIWAGRTLWLATMHRKEQVIAPLLEPLGLQVRVPPDLDTDQFGTFSRDRDRPGDRYATARLKAEAALKLTGGDLALASEGSFMPHPDAPWLALNHELLLLIDQRQGYEISAEVTAGDTNFAAQDVRSWSEAETFAQRVGFPAHSLISITPQAITKGINTWVNLRQELESAWRDNAIVHLETDMRAHHNPTRMTIIAQAAHQLRQRLESLCPACHTPGFGETRSVSGLRCAACGCPTPLAQAKIWGCPKCGYEERRPLAVSLAEPMYCFICNP